MATSKFKTTQYAASHFVESAGAILFHVSKRQICLVYHRQRNEWLLAKGRRNIGEARAQAALREVTEETGMECDLMQMNMITRAPPAIEILEHYPDEPRTHNAVTEPFWVTIRNMNEGNDVKLIYWYMAAIRGSREIETVTPKGREMAFEARLFDFGEALEMITYKLDRDILLKAVEIFELNETEVPSLSA
nr:hypothetical protein CFP56_41330 [Quercus suber]